MQCDVSQSEGSEENKTKKKKKFLTEFFSGGVYRFLPALPLTPVFYRSEKFGWRGDVVAKARNIFHFSLPSSFLSLFLSPRMYISHCTPRVIYHNPQPNFFCLSTFFSAVRSPHPILAVYLLAFLFFFLGFFCFYYPSDSKAGNCAYACAGIPLSRASGYFVLFPTPLICRWPLISYLQQ